MNFGKNRTAAQEELNHQKCSHKYVIKSSEESRVHGAEPANKPVDGFIRTFGSLVRTTEGIRWVFISL